MDCGDARIGRDDVVKVMMLVWERLADRIIRLLRQGCMVALRVLRADAASPPDFQRNTTRLPLHFASPAAPSHSTASPFLRLGGEESDTMNGHK